MNAPEPTYERLRRAVEWLNPAAKRAMYDAAGSHLIARWTWRGCAFNAAGNARGYERVRSIRTAAGFFGLDPRAVMLFIGAWDRMPGSHQEASERLRSALLDVGLDTPARTDFTDGGHPRAALVAQSEPAGSAKQSKGYYVGLEFYDEVVAEMKEMYPEPPPAPAPATLPFDDDRAPARAVAPSEIALDLLVERDCRFARRTLVRAAS